MPAPTSWLTFLHLFGGCFNAPSQLLFEQLVTAWALCPGRRTLTRLRSVIPAERQRHHGAYARWVREGDCSMDELWRSLAVAHKMTAWGLNVVVLALRVPSPWGGEPLALPVMACLRRKGEDELTLVEQAASMVFQLARWLPEHRFRGVADGAYASLLRLDFLRAVVITRLRCDAALNDPAPPRTGRPGRPRTRGDRLPTPPELTKQVTNWASVKVCVRSQMVERKLRSRTLLWYETARSRPLLLVILRDPTGHQHDDFFITSDTSLTSAEVAGLYSDRWAIEDTNTNGNLQRHIGIQNPQCWVGDGPERVVVHAGHPTWLDRPWYTSKRTASFADALAGLRGETWSAILAAPARDLDSPQIPTTLISVLRTRRHQYHESQNSPGSVSGHDLLSARPRGCVACADGRRPSPSTPVTCA